MQMITRITRFSAALFFYFFAALHPYSAADEDQFFYLIDLQDFACLLQNVDVIRHASDDIVFIDMNQCPPALAGSLLGGLDNVAPDVHLSPADRTDKLLTLRRDIVDCLTTLRIPGDGRHVKFYPLACSFSVD